MIATDPVRLAAPVEAGANSADINRMLDRLDYLETIGLDRRVLDGVPPHRVSQLRRLGERYSADGVRDLPEARRLASPKATASPSGFIR